MKRKLVGSALAMLFAGAMALVCTGTADAVANGQAATPGMYPFAVKLTMTNIPKPDGTTYNSGCSGALIAPEWIITAGHCFHDVNRVPVSGPPQYQTTAALGTVNVTNDPGEVRTVVDVAQSPVNDVALAKLSAPVYDIAPLVVDPAAPTVGQNLELAGWGATSDVNAAPSNQLYLGGFAVSSTATNTIGVQGVTPAPDTSACLYDSGAPYFIPAGDQTGLLVSVENNGPDCPHTAPETTARVDVLTQWILQTQANN
ncbi:MAG TPA: trypsin-like serine protease [Pseudonocardiaceae bacterium]|jgi:secreted trypsin-like serine protease